jgi:osmoprotectant transport system permease protein
MTRPLGFNNTYAVGMLEPRARELGITRISQLRDHPALRLRFTNEFMSRADGWPALQRTYALPQRDVQGLDHDLAYRGLAASELDATDLYSTDAEIEYYGIRILEDDLGCFPRYDAVYLYRADLEQRAPRALARLSRLEGAIAEPAMIDMNARAKLRGESEAAIAASLAQRELGLTDSVGAAAGPGLSARIARTTLDHLHLVAISLSAAVLVALPLGVACARHPRLGALALALVGIIQTVPALALLVVMIPLLGIGSAPAIVALFLYSLLPILRNTVTGLHQIPDSIRESAEALGLSPGARLRIIELPLAARTILAGIKTSAVINVGTATLGALIGAGGYGQPILTGIRLDSSSLILEGAVPAAALALLVQAIFELAERRVVPRGLRLGRAAPADPDDPQD